MGSFPHSRVSQSAFSRILVSWGVKWDVTRCYEKRKRDRDRNKSERKERFIYLYVYEIFELNEVKRI